MWYCVLGASVIILDSAAESSKLTSSSGITWSVYLPSSNTAELPSLFMALMLPLDGGIVDDPDDDVK